MMTMASGDYMMMIYNLRSYILSCYAHAGS